MEGKERNQIELEFACKSCLARWKVKVDLKEFHKGIEIKCPQCGATIYKKKIDV